MLEARRVAVDGNAVLGEVRACLASTVSASTPQSSRSAIVTYDIEYSLSRAVSRARNGTNGRAATSIAPTACFQLTARTAGSSVGAASFQVAGRSTGPIASTA